MIAKRGLLGWEVFDKNGNHVFDIRGNIAAAEQAVDESSFRVFVIHRNGMSNKYPTAKMAASEYGLNITDWQE